MTGMGAILAEGAARVLGWTLLHAVWQGAAAGIAAAVLLGLLPRERPALRYAAATGALVLFAAGVGLTGAELGRDWIEHASCWERVEARGTLVGSAARTCAGHGVFAKEVSTTQADAASAGRDGPTTSPAPEEEGGSAVPFVHAVAFILTPVAGWIALLWMLGVACQAVRFGRELLVARRLRRDARGVVQDERVGAALERAAARVRSGPPPPVARSPAVDSPCVLGGLRPLLLLPPWTERLAPAELEMLLAHELAHVRRHDYAANLLQRLLEVVFFFHPAVRWLSCRVREEREACCDRRAAAGSLASLRRYVAALATAERLRSGRCSVAAGVGLRHGPLSGRLRRLLEAEGRGRPPSAGTLAPRLATAAALAALAVASWSAGSEYGITQSSFAVMVVDLREREPIPPPPVAPERVSRTVTRASH